MKQNDCQPGMKIAATQQKELRVFIVEDSHVVLKNLIALLAMVQGIQIVGVARTANASIQGILALSPEVVILDFQLPDGNGLDVLKGIKHAHTVPMVMMLTNYAYPQYRERCLQSGANYFFDKSQDFEQVVKLCRQLSLNQVSVETIEK